MGGNSQFGSWKQGEIGGYKFCIKVFECGSVCGIDGGCISKLEIRKDGKILANYDRGWDGEPAEEVVAVLEQILAAFN